MHPVSYDTEKGTYESAYTNVINFFSTNFDRKFVEYRICEDGDGSGEELDSDDLVLDQVMNLVDGHINKDKLKSNILQPLKH